MTGLILIFLFSLSGGAWAHGVEGEVTYLPHVVMIKASYDTGEPMSYARVEIYAPDSKIKFQIGRTDRNGRFAFVPDVSGQWRLAVLDGLGHRLSLNVKVNLELLAHDTTPKPLVLPSASPLCILRSRVAATLLGLLLIGGLFGWLKELLAWLQDRNLRKD